MSEVSLPNEGAVYSDAQADALYEKIWNFLQQTNVVDPRNIRKDLMTWRRGSAQLAIKINAALDNLSIYSVLLSGVTPTEALFRHLLHYNVLQRRESLGMMEKDGKNYIVLKYTMELEMIDQDSLQRHIFALQEIADKLDTELAEKFGGSMQFEDWQKMDQSSVDNLLDNLFG
ncbi:MAG: hypothetical protein O7A08_02250 [SAR324 cluster bacterium]|nr:hypothetical protein [SAR324 cluster bacterium]MCZ6531769.1 hypothetical protein [SAR324 cluster bacterium]MCZ6558121.1 hypothetical protein [SAR324 cluster bacterium]MCZ6626621.1 hypothetical protein [SAR324 cluster bacterium]MCZ6645053.1 hypothetical protein [SAR324 cluster bacterium]